METGIDSLQSYIELLQELTGDASSPAEALSILWEAIDANAHSIFDKSKPYDAFDILANVRFYETAGGPELRAKFKHQGLASAVEIAADILRCRPSRHASPASSSRVFNQDDATVVQEIIDEVRETLRLMSLAIIVEALNSENEGRHFEVVTRMRDLNVRNLSYPHMVAESLLALFEVDGIAHACSDVMGYTASAFFSCFDSIQELLTDGTKASLDKKSRLMAQFERLIADWLDHDVLLDQDNWLSAHFDPNDEQHKQLALIWDDIWSHPSRGTTFTVNQVAANSGLDVATIRAILDDYSTDFSEQDPTAAIKLTYFGKSAMRQTPLLVDGDGNYTLVHTALHTEIFREISEEKLKRSVHWDTYQKKRGLFLERTAIGYLKDILTPDAIFQNIEYMFPTGDSESIPELYRGSAECDALILLADAAIVVEAKAGSVHAPSRRRNWKILKRDLNRLVKHASSQASRISGLIMGDRGLQSRDGDWLNLSHLKAVYPLTVSLDDLTGIVTTTSELLDHGLVDEDWLPWTISLHDLRIIRDLTQSRTEFLLYLATRLDPQRIREFQALDELDIFLHFYAHRLAGIQGDGEDTASMPDAASYSSSARDVDEVNFVNLLMNATAELDAWYLSHGPKPRIDADSRALDLVAQLDERGQRGWLTAGMILLSLGRSSQNDLLDKVVNALHETAQDGLAHSVTVGGLFLGNSPYVLAFLTSDLRESPDDTQTRIENYVRAKKYQLHADTGIGILLLPGFPLRLIHTYFVDEPWREDPALHELGRSFNLRLDPPLTG